MCTAATARPDCCPVCAGALLAVGITNCGVQDECDPAFALLCESVNHDDPGVRIGAIMGLGLAYAGTQKSDVQVCRVVLTDHCRGDASPAVRRVKHWCHPGSTNLDLACVGTSKADRWVRTACHAWRPGWLPHEEVDTSMASFGGAQLPAFSALVAGSLDASPGSTQGHAPVGCPSLLPRVLPCMACSLQTETLPRAVLSACTLTGTLCPPCRSC